MIRSLRLDAQLSDGLLPETINEVITGCPKSDLEVGDEVTISGRFYVVSVQHSIGQLLVSLSNQGAFTVKKLSKEST